MRYHLQHPTQSAACGTNHTALTLSTATWKAKPEHLRCKRCAKVLTALEAGRPVYSGYEDPDNQDRGPRAVPPAKQDAPQCPDCGLTGTHMCEGRRQLVTPGGAPLRDPCDCPPDDVAQGIHYNECTPGRPWLRRRKPGLFSG